MDTFDDREIAWEAFHPQGRDGGVALTCREGDVLSFDAYADNMFVNSIGSVLKKDEPVRVRLKVDDYPIVETRGAYPNTLAISDGDVRKIMTELLDGNEARIRTQHGDEQHTFILSLAGFREAGAWALGKCGYVLKNRDDDEEEDE